jgi:hypothetical protein
MGEITLPYANNARFEIEDLVNHFNTEKINYMIVGASHLSLANHRNPNSLDVWIRKHKSVIGHEDTCQAVIEVITQLIKHNQFSRAIRINPRTGKMCKALVFCDNKK